MGELKIDIWFRAPINLPCLIRSRSWASGTLVLLSLQDLAAEVLWKSNGLAQLLRLTMQINILVVDFSRSARSVSKLLSSSLLFFRVKR